MAAGMLTCVLVYPLYLLVFTLLRMSRSQVPRSHRRSQRRPDLEFIDVFLFYACVCVDVSACLWSRYRRRWTRSRWRLMISWTIPWVELPSSFITAR